jgi:hypothetical protein
MPDKRKKEFKKAARALKSYVDIYPSATRELMLKGMQMRAGAKAQAAAPSAPSLSRKTA